MMSKNFSSLLSIAILCCFPVLNSYSQLSQWDWARSISSGNDDNINALAVDKSNNDVYVAGEWSGDLNVIFPSGANPSTDFSNTYGNADGFVAKYDSTGDLIWAFKVGGGDSDLVNSLALDSDGNIYVSGFFGTGTSYFSGVSPHTGGSTLTNSSYDDFFIAKYNSDGEFIWVRRSESDAGDASGLDLTTNSSAVYAVGRFVRRTDFGSLTTDQNPGQEDLFLIKYKLDGDELWLAEAGSNDNDVATRVIADETGVYFTGYFTGSTLNIFDGTGSYSGFLENANSGNGDILLVSLDSDGNYNWSEKISSNNGERGRGICMDDDSLYLTGRVNDNTTFPEYSGNPVSTTSSRDIFISSHAKLNGNTGWVIIPPSSGAGLQRGMCIDSDANGNLFITGEFDQDLLFPNDITLSGSGGDDVFLASYTTNGVFRWAERAGSTGDEEALAVAVGKNGAIYIGGNYADLFTAGSLSLPSASGSNGYLAKVSEYPPIENDAPCEAILLPVGDTCNSATYNNNGASDSGLPDPGCGTYGGGDVWFKAVIPESGNLYIGTDASEDDTYPPINGWMYRVEMALYTGTCGSLLPEGCYSQTSGYNFRTSSAFLLDKNPGDTVWIRIWEAFGNDYGNFSICTYDPGHYPAWDIPRVLCGDGDIIDLDTSLAETRFGNVNSVESFSGVLNPGNILGDTDLSIAGFWMQGNWIKLDLRDTIPPGEALLIYFRSNMLVPGPTQMKLMVSQDDITYIPHSFNPETDMDDVTPHYIITEHPTRYLLIENDNAGGGGFAVDAVEYFYRGTRGGTWSGSGVTGSLFDPSGLSGPVPITYSVGGSSLRTDSTITILITNTEAGVLSGDTMVCSGTNEVTLKLQGNQGELFTWESSEDGFLSVASSGVASPTFSISNLSQTTAVRVIAQGTSCEPDTSNLVTITVFEDPVSDPGPGGETCGNTFGLQAIPSSGLGQWSKTSGPGDATFTPSADNPIVSVEVDQFGDYAFTWTETNGICSDDSSLTVSFFEIPLINPGSGGDTCGLSFSLNALASVGDGLWSMESGPGTASFFPSDTAPNALVTVSQYGAYSFIWAESNSICNDEDTIPVVFYDQPLADAGADVEICISEGSYTISASTSANGTILWTSSGDGSFDAPGTDNPIYTLGIETESVFLIKTLSSTGSCAVAIDSMTLSLTPVPLADAGADAEICISEGSYTITGSSSANGTILWTSSGDGSFDAPEMDNPTYTFGSETDNVFLIKTVSSAGSCADAVDSMTLTLTPVPFADAGSDAEICISEGSYTISASTSANGTILWTSSGDGGFDAPGTDNPIYTLGTETESVFLIKTVSSAGSCAAAIDSMTLTLTPVPFADAGADAEICISTGTYTISGSSSANGTILWTSSGDGSFDAPEMDIPTYTFGSETDNVFLIKTASSAGSCAQVLDSMILTFTPLPTVDAGPDFEVCWSEGIFGLAGTSSSNGTILWTSGGNGSFDDASIDNPIYNIGSEVESVILIKTVSSLGSCADAVDSMVLTLTPPYSDAGPDAEVCNAAGSYNIIGSSSANGTILWTSSGDGSFDDATTDNPIYTLGTETDNVTLIKTVTSTGSCSDAVSSMILTLSLNPNSDAAPDAEICISAGTYDISGSSSANGNILWTSSGDGSFDDVTTDNPIYSLGTETGSVILIKTVSGAGSCSDAVDSMILGLTPAPVTNAGSGGETCGLEFQLSAIPSIGLGTWTKTSGPGMSTFTPSVNSPDALVIVSRYGSYDFEWTEKLGDCSATDMVTVKFHEQPVADAGSDQVLEFVFSTSFEAASPNIGSGTWTLISGSGRLADENDPISRVTELALGENEFKWTIKSEGCEDVSDDVVITVNDLLTPTVITPNNDGQNDFLVFPGVEELTGCELIIYNRWGSEVYRNSEYQNDWEGRDHKSRELIPDTYYYILRIESEKITKDIQGYVEIKR